MESTASTMDSSYSLPQASSPENERETSGTPPTGASASRDQGVRRGRFAVFTIDKRRTDDDETSSDLTKGDRESTTPDSTSHPGSAPPAEERTAGLNLVHVHDFLADRERAFNDLFDGMRSQLCGFLESSSAALALKGSAVAAAPVMDPASAGGGSTSLPSRGPPSPSLTSPRSVGSADVHSRDIAAQALLDPALFQQLMQPPTPPPGGAAAANARDEQSAVLLWKQLGGPLERAVRKNRQLEEENSKLQAEASALRRQLGELQRAEAARRSGNVQPLHLSCGRPPGDGMFLPGPRMGGHTGNRSSHSSNAPSVAAASDGAVASDCALFLEARSDGGAAASDFASVIEARSDCMTSAIPSGSTSPRQDIEQSPMSADVSGTYQRFPDIDWQPSSMPYAGSPSPMLSRTLSDPDFQNQRGLHEDLSANHQDCWQQHAAPPPADCSTEVQTYGSRGTYGTWRRWHLHRPISSNLPNGNET